MDYIVFAFIFVCVLVFLIWFGMSVKGVDELERELRERERIIES